MSDKPRLIDLKKPRLTEKYGGGFGLVKVKDDEQEVESPYPNTLKAILECFNRLGELENAIESGELGQVVRCGECVWWRDRQVKLSDGTYRDYKPDEPWSVTTDVGINIGSHCTKHGFENAPGSWFWTNENDYCSRGTKLDGKDGDGE